LLKRARVRVGAAGAAVALAAALLPGQALPAEAGGSGGSCERRTNDTYEKLLDCVTLKGVREHQAALQEIADANDDPFYPGTRAAGTKGYADSVDYVAGLLEDAGYRVTLDPMEFEFNFPAVLRQTAPVAATYPSGVFSASGSGTVEGGVIPVDINLVGDRASSSGCEPADFAGLDFSGAADIALIQRGTCNFGTKARNAQNAGAEAVVIFNQGNTPEREGLIVADASSLDDGTVVMAGAHLDSVTEGPGINDDGSGTAALLETALMMAKVRPQNSMRFAFWAAEEPGLLGSTDYVTGLSQAERDRIGLYMNYDMIGSSNYIFMALDADESTFPADGVPIPAGSTAIEDLFESYYTMVGEPYDDTAFDGRSDYQAFIDNDIPAGGLFTGAEVPKTEEQAIIWGGFTGEQFDPCYHEACDTLGNHDRRALEVNSDLVAFAQLTYAFSTESVNGVRGQRVPGPRVHLPRPAGAEGTFAESGGGHGPAMPTS